MINEIDLSESWRLMELKDICLKKAEYGSGAKAIDFEYKKPRYVRITDIDDNGNLKKNNIVSPDLVEEKYFLEENDLLFARSGSVGKTYLYKKSDGLCQFAGYLIRFKPNPAIIDSDYLNYVVKSPHYWNWVESKKKTMTISNINAKQYSGLKIPVPPLNTQNKIVETLEKAEKLKEWRFEADELADDYLDSAFHSIFGDPIKNEENWKVKKLSDVADVVSGVTKGRKLQNKETVFTPYLRVANVQDGYLDLDEIKEIEVLTTDVEKYQLFEGDIVLTEGGDPDKLGRGAVWHNEVPNCIHQNHIFRVRLKNSDLNPIYLSKLIGSLYGKLYFLKSAKQTTGIASINSTQLKKFPVNIPPIELQNQFSQIVQQVETIKSYQSESKQQIDNLFNTLMQKTFKGELVC